MIDPLSTNDIIQHVIHFGIDTYPPISLDKERTRLHIFYEEARSRWGQFFDRIVASETEYQIFKTIGTLTFPTLSLTPRGPVFKFPVVLPANPNQQLTDPDAVVETFSSIRKLFFSAVPEKKIMRFGMVRELLFGVGDDPSLGLISDRAEFASAKLDNASALSGFKDDKYNIRISLQSGKVSFREQMPALGTSLPAREVRAISVSLDVNNIAIHELQDADIEEVTEKACSLWPDKLLEFVNERRGS